jgi:hypothetical protein
MASKERQAPDTAPPPPTPYRQRAQRSWQSSDQETGGSLNQRKVSLLASLGVVLYSADGPVQNARVPYFFRGVEAVRQVSCVLPVEDRVFHLGAAVEAHDRDRASDSSIVAALLCTGQLARTTVGLAGALFSIAASQGPPGCAEWFMLSVRGINGLHLQPHWLYMRW